LTKAGQHVLSLHDEVHNSIAQFITQGLDEDEVTQLATLLNKVITANSV
jgi:hypothetical protein